MGNEDLAERIPTRTDFLKYVERSNFQSTEKQTIEFLEDTTQRESFAPSDDPTEEELDQAIFEASYSKPVHETDEYKKISNSFDLEVENTFKALNFTPNNSGMIHISKAIKLQEK